MIANVFLKILKYLPLPNIIREGVILKSIRQIIEYFQRAYHILQMVAFEDTKHNVTESERVICHLSRVEKLKYKRWIVECERPYFTIGKLWNLSCVHIELRFFPLKLDTGLTIAVYLRKIAENDPEL